MAGEMRRRTELRGILCDQVGDTVTDMLLEYMPAADWVDKVDSRFDLVDRRLDLLDQRFERIDQRFALMDQRLDLFEKRMERLEYSMDTMVDSQRTWIRWMISATVTSTLAAVGAVVSIAVSAL